MKDETKDLLHEAKQLSGNIRECLPQGFSIGSVSVKAKTPTKALSLREALIYRASDLAEAAIFLYEDRRFVPASIIVRSLMETTGILLWLHKKIEKAVTHQSLEGIDGFMMRGLIGSKEDEPEFPALNALSAIDHVEKEFKGFREMYDGLSEFAHPNWSGTYGTYGKLDRKRMYVEFGTAIEEKPWHFMLGPLVTSLVIFRERYNDMPNTFHDFIKLCEDDLNKNGI